MCTVKLNIERQKCGQHSSSDNAIIPSSVWLSLFQLLMLMSTVIEILTYTYQRQYFTLFYSLPEYKGDTGCKYHDEDPIYPFAYRTHSHNLGNMSYCCKRLIIQQTRKKNDLINQTHRAQKQTTAESVGIVYFGFSTTM